MGVRVNNCRRISGKHMLSLLRNIVIFVLFDPYFFLFPPLRSLVPGYVIKDAVEENYESDHDS